VLRPNAQRLTPNAYVLHRLKYLLAGNHSRLDPLCVEVQIASIGKAAYSPIQPHFYYIAAYKVY
jgi:hypothetical protein